MSSIRDLVVRIVLALTIGGCGAEAQDRGKREAFYGGSLHLPDGAMLILDPKRYPDFNMYDIKSDQRDILSLYVGNAANPHDFQYETIYIGACVAKSSRRITDGTLARISRDTIIEFENEDPPTMLHFFYRELPEGIARQADTLIDSFRPSVGRTCILRK
jgi:hypothetical protein